MQVELTRITTERVTYEVPPSCPECGAKTVSQPGNPSVEALVLESWGYAAPLETDGTFGFEYAVRDGRDYHITGLACLECGYLLAGGTGI